MTEVIILKVNLTITLLMIKNRPNDHRGQVQIFVTDASG